VNPSMTRRKADIVVKTRGVYPFWDKPAGDLTTGQAATGV
jgi:arabinogalactan endo-1,4-beta-galactosidase